MHHLRHWFQTRTTQQRRQLLAAAAVVAALFGLWLSNQSATVPQKTPTAAEVNLPSKVRVHVVGAVAIPGLYELELGSIANDAISAAGGFTADALQQTVNLARIVSDGEQILVRSLTEVLAGSGDGLISLNLATPSELEGLPGIGPSLAKRIAEYRSQRGSFSSIEEVTSVSGIGTKLFDQIKDLITL